MRRHKLRMEVSASEWEAVGIQVTTQSVSGTTKANRMLIPYSESARDLLRKALALVESGLAKQQPDVFLGGGSMTVNVPAGVTPSRSGDS